MLYKHHNNKTFFRVACTHAHTQCENYLAQTCSVVLSFLQQVTSPSPPPSSLRLALSVCEVSSLNPTLSRENYPYPELKSSVSPTPSQISLISCSDDWQWSSVCHHHSVHPPVYGRTLHTHTWKQHALFLQGLINVSQHAYNSIIFM